MCAHLLSTVATRTKNMDVLYRETRLLSKFSHVFINGYRDATILSIAYHESSVAAEYEHSSKFA